jgi:hypothetical protein
MPQSKRSPHEDGESAYAHLFSSSENNGKSLLLGDSLNDKSLSAGLISSFINEGPRTPLDLIQVPLLADYAFHSVMFFLSLVLRLIFHQLLLLSIRNMFLRKTMIHDITNMI